MGSKRFTIDSLVCLLKVISISIRYGKADLATSKLLLVGFYCAQECREGLGQLHKNTSLTDNSASQLCTSLFLCFQRAVTNLQVSSKLYQQEVYRGSSAITSCFGHSISYSTPTTSAAYVGYLLLTAPRTKEKLKYNFFSQKSSRLWVSMPIFKLG